MSKSEVKKLPKCGEKTTNGKPTTFAKIYMYQWHIIVYATFGSLLCFYLNDWIDSHAPEFYHNEYGSFVGIPVRFLYVIPSVLNFLLLFAVFRKTKPSRTNVLIAPITVASIISLTQFVGFLGFSMKTVHLPLLIVNFLIAMIVGLGCWTHYNVFYLISQTKMTESQAKREYETRVKIFGALLQSATLLLISGGLGITLTIVSETGIPGLVPETRVWWPIGTAAILIYLAYGVYCVFLLGFLATTGELNDYIVTKEHEQTRNEEKERH